jgi:hypothetical protein
MGNVQWTPAGVTATFITPTVNMTHRRRETRLSPFHGWTGLYASLIGPFSQSAIHRQVPEQAVIDRMAAAADPALPAWDQRIDETVQFIRQLPRRPTENLGTLTVRLPVAESRSKTLWPLLASLEHPPPMPAHAEQQQARKEAAKQLTLLSALVPGIRPATTGELLWLSAFHMTFGGVEPDYTRPEFTADPAVPRLVLPLGDGHLRRRGGRRPSVQIDAPILIDGAVDRQDVYQAFLVVSDFARAWDYPEAALAEDLANLDVRTTTHILGRAVPNQQARNALDKFFKATDWVETESAGDATPHIDALTAREDLNRELEQLASHGGPATPAVIVIRVGASNPDELEESCKLLQATLDPVQTRFIRLAGQQTSLWTATLPGSGQQHRLNRWARAMHSKDLAGLGLFHGHDLGDPDGRLYALHAADGDASPIRLVFRNPMRGPRSEHGNAGATSGAVGDMGSGKSLSVKMDADTVLAMGGGVFAIDTSEQREWQRACRGFPTASIVVDPADPTWTFDPLRTFTSNLPGQPERRADMLRLAERHTIGFFAIRLSIPSEDDDRYDALESAVQDLLSDDPPLPPTSPNLLRVLQWRASDSSIGPAPDDPRLRPVTDPGAQSSHATLVTRLRNLARSQGKGRNIMGDGRTLDLSAPCIVISDPGVDYSTIEGRATVYLASAYAAAYMNATPRFNLATITELRILDEHQWGSRLVDDLLTQTRRANGGLAADSQLARHYRRPELFIERTAARTRDENAARAAIEFVGAEPTAALIAQLQTMATGLKLYRDRDGNVGIIDVIPPIDERRMLLFRADPDAFAIDPDATPEPGLVADGETLTVTSDVITVS